MMFLVGSMQGFVELVMPGFAVRMTVMGKVVEIFSVMFAQVALGGED